MVLRLKRGVSMPVCGSRLAVHANGNPIALLLRSSAQDTFITDADKVRLPACPILDLQVFDEFGQCCLERQHFAWDPAALFVPIHPETHEIGPLPVLPRDWSCCDFLVASDVDILPKPEVREPVGTSGYEVVRVMLPEQIKVVGFSVDGPREAELRRSQISVTGQNVSTDWLHADDFSTRHVHGDSLPAIGLALKATNPLSVICAKATVGDWQAEWDATEPSHDLRPPLRCWADVMRVLVQVATDKEIHEVQIERNLPWTGAILFSDGGGASPLSAEDALEARAVRTGRLAVSFARPDKILGLAAPKPGDFRLCEEHRELRDTELRAVSPKDHGNTEDRWMLMPSALPGVHGLGGSLRLMCQGYQPLTVANEVVDHGLIVDVSSHGQDLSVTLHSPMEFESLHSVVILGESDGRLKMRSQSLTWFAQVSTSEITVAVPDFAKIVAVVLSYDGWRLGAWWSQDLGPALTRAGTSDDEGRCAAALLRWMRAPLLSRANWCGKAARTWFRQFILAAPANTLGTWLRDEVLTLDGVTLRLAADDAAWLDAVREVMLDEAFQFSPETSGSLVEMLGQSVAHSGDAVGTVCHACAQVLRMCPVAAVSLCATTVQQLAAQDRRSLIEAVLIRCGGPSYNRQRVQQLTGVDPFAVQGFLPDVQQVLARPDLVLPNFRRLAHHQPFRNYALWEWLRELRFHFPN